MTDHGRPYAVNCSLLFSEVPLLRRPAAARAAGFEAIELWWPFDSPIPEDRQVDALVAAVRDAGVRCVGLNFWGGDLSGADAGRVSIVGSQSDFREHVPVAVAIGERLGVSVMNALYGVRVAGVAPEAQDELAVENLAIAARAARRIEATVVIEPLSGPKPYPLRRAVDAAAVVHRVRATGEDNVAILADLYHLAVNGENLATLADLHGPEVAHVQIADVPGRGQPGTGELNWSAVVHDLERRGFAGWVALEYVPVGPTERSLDWLARERRAAHPRS